MLQGLMLPETALGAHAIQYIKTFCPRLGRKDTVEIPFSLDPFVLLNQFEAVYMG